MTESLFDVMRVARTVCATEDPILQLSRLADLQRVTSMYMRVVAMKARDEGHSWQDLGNACGIPRETVFRQYQSGSPIVVIRGRHSSLEN